MKVRAAADLQDYIDGELSWRKRELSSHRFLLQQVKDHEHQRRLLLRTGVCMVYAHWEGFAKNVSVAYLDYIGRMGLKVGDLSENLIAACLRGQIRESGMSKKPLDHTGLVLRVRGQLADVARFSGGDLVDTESNLNSEVLRNLTCLLGIDYSAFEGKAHLLDEKLLKNRNNIAHGQYLDVDIDDYELLHTEIIAMMSELGDRLANAALLKSHLGASPT
jgi:hypothetical protein